MNFNAAMMRHRVANVSPSRSPHRGEVARSLLAAVMCTVLGQPPVVFAADQKEIANSALEFGGSVGKLLWVARETHSRVTESEADQYRRLAYEIKGQIDLGRASSSLIKANFDVVGTWLAYGATVDPEPLSKAVAGVAAWGAKKTGDALGQAVVEQSEKQARAILAQGLKNSGLSAAQLKNMTADDLRAKVADLKIGGQTLSEILKNDQDSLRMLQAHATDIAMDIGVAALAKSEGTAADAKRIKKELAETRHNIDGYQKEVTAHLNGIDSRLSGLEQATQVANQKLDNLKKELGANSKVVQALTQASYSGWTTSQKLQAVKSGLFPDITPRQKDALIESLQSEKTREDLVAGLQKAAGDFGNLAKIAKDIGLPGDLVKGLTEAQIAATGIAKFATGDVLGGIASLTSLAGLGTPDAAAERHAAMMKYLDQKFAEIDKKLNKIIELQVQTLRAVAALAQQQLDFRREVLGQLDRIENTVLGNQMILQAILLSKWTECDALINTAGLNEKYEFRTRESLTRIVRDMETPYRAGSCYPTFVNFLDAYVRSANWSKQLIAADSFPAEAILTDPSLQKSYSAFQSQRNVAYTSARDFIIKALPDASKSPALYLARFSQPVADAPFAAKLDSVLAKQEIHERLSAFKCNQTDVLSPALRDLICYQTADGEASPPRDARWQALVGTPLIGPQAFGLIDKGIALSTIVDFAVRNDQGSFIFVKPEAIENFSRDGTTAQLHNALKEHKGAALLAKLQWLSEANLLQQSITNGDYTAQLVERKLYDSATKALNTDSTFAASPAQQAAIAAMRNNPTLARNVVLLAMRHGMEDALGGPDKANAVQYSQTFYGRALHDFTGAQACDGSKLAREKLKKLFPNWKFVYVVTTQQKGENPNLTDCPVEFEPDPNSPTPPPPAQGAGVAVALSDFYVLAPSPIILSNGAFEQSESLQKALVYRDRLSQAISDRNMATTVRGLAGDGSGSGSVASSTAFALLNDGWGWQIRATSK